MNCFPKVTTHLPYNETPQRPFKRELFQSDEPDQTNAKTTVWMSFIGQISAVGHSTTFLYLFQASLLFICKTQLYLPIQGKGRLKACLIKAQVQRAAVPWLGGNGAKHRGQCVPGCATRTLTSLNCVLKKIHVNKNPMLSTL